MSTKVFVRDDGYEVTMTFPDADNPTVKYQRDGVAHRLLGVRHAQEVELTLLNAGYREVSPC